MNLKSHLMLSAFLMDLVPVRKAAFLYGSVEPDIILVSYLSGSMHGKSFHGHDYRNMSKRIQSVLARMQEGKGHGLLHSYRLGKLIHYIVDSFTFPHNEMFHGSLRSHMLYEDKLEEGLQRRLKNMQTAFKVLSAAALTLAAAGLAAAYKAGILTDQTAMTDFVSKAGFWAPVVFIMIQIISEEKRHYNCDDA